MPSGHGFFDRLREGDRGGVRSVHQRTDRIHESIMRHLQSILNTRHDASSSVPEFGLPALPSFDLSSPAEDTRRAIERSIRTYEPRLDGVTVRHLETDPDDPLKMRFEIVGRLATGEERVGVRFNTVVDLTGGWKVQG
jgi:type VI secretion system lysozyme-like protein